MSPTETIELVGALAALATKGSDAISRVHDWVKGDGEAPLDVLPELPDFTRNHLEHVAMIERARKAGNIP